MCSDRSCPDRHKQADARRPYASGEAIIRDAAFEEKQQEQAELARYTAAMEAWNKKD